MKIKQRFAGITWGSDNTAIVYDRWWNTRNMKTYVFNPSGNSEPTVLWDRNYQDRYSDPGDFVTKKNELGRYTLELDKNNAYLIGDGYSKKGKFPFVWKSSLLSLPSKRI